MAINDFSDDPWEEGVQHTHTREPGDDHECLCGSLEVDCVLKANNHVAHCVECGTSRKCISKAELKLRPRKYREGNKYEVGPKQRMHILQRDRNMCVICRRTDQRLEMGHLISLKEGPEYLSDDQLMDDMNIAAMCPQCNSDLGARSVSFQFLVAFRIEWERRQS